MAPVAVMLNLPADALTAAQRGIPTWESHDWYQSSPLPVTNWCYSCPSDTACPYQHIRNGTSCAAPHGQIKLSS